jgi:hypothetical protein
MTEDKLKAAAALRDEIKEIESVLVDAETAKHDDMQPLPVMGLSPSAFAACRRIVMDDLRDQLAEKRRQFEAL